MQKALGYVFLFFAAIVGVNYALISLQELVGRRQGLSSPSGLLWATQASDYGLTSIDFSFFGRNGFGKSYITQGYGNTPSSYLYANHWHNGIDIAAVYGAPIYAASAGTVLATGNQDDYCWHRGFGEYVAVKDDLRKVVQWYAHLGSINVSVGQPVAQGTEIGTVGATGYETGAHLHFSIFDLNNFSMTPRNGCGPDPTGQDRDPIPFFQNL
jgi:murein DD-endopeptidase MepM/ murein hydrolase activator NlpD